MLQNSTPEALSQRIQQLADAMSRTQAQLEQSQHQLEELRQQMATLQQQIAKSVPAGTPVTDLSASQTPTPPSSDELQTIRDTQAVHESEIATLHQSKVESESKYPIKITGLLLMNGFVNTGAVDMPATPTMALPGSGSTGASIRQTILGFDARGPHLFGAYSYADLRVDFDGSPQSVPPTGIYSGAYNASATLLRLRTVHAGLEWSHTNAFFSLDRPIFSPDSPTSLTAVAEPALAWSGNLWTWNPQAGVTQDMPLSGSTNLRLQAAMVDVGDAPVTLVIPPPGAMPTIPPTAAQQSRWPGLEARVALLRSSGDDNGNHIGVGGYFSPHVTPLGRHYDAWAGTLDAHLVLPMHFELSGSFYRGLALGGLGGGAYNDVAYYADPGTGRYFARPLNDVGGWAQLKERINRRLEMNEAFGLDNAFALLLRRYIEPTNTPYQNLARNRTFTGNVIYSPNAYLQLSLEYRYLQSFPVAGASSASNIIGVAAGYKF